MNTSDIQAEEQRAIELEESGDELAALEIWLRLVRVRPMAGFYCRAGGALHSLGRYAEAEAAFRSALELDSKMPEAAASLALSLIDQEKFTEAVEVLDRAPAGGDQTLTRSLRGHALKGLGRSEEALEAFREAARLDPSYDEAFLNIGLLLRGVDDEGAEAAFRRVVELDGQCAAAQRELGWVERQAGRLPLAERHLRRAIELNPDDAWAWVYLGNTRWAKGEFSAAEEAMQKALEISPNEWYPNWELASFYEDAAKPEKAAQFYHQALKASPEELAVLLSYGRFLLRQGDREGAGKYLRRACELDPGNDKARQLLREATHPG